MRSRLLPRSLAICAAITFTVATTQGVGWAAKRNVVSSTSTTSTTTKLTTTTTAAPVTTTTAAPVTSTTAAPVTSTTTAPVTSTTVAPVTSTTVGALTTTTASVTTTVAPALVPATTATYTHSRQEAFLPGWFKAWGLTQPWHSGSMTDTDGSTFLRTRIVAGTHDGTSFRLPMPGADVAHLRYRVRYNAGFNPSASAHNVKMPGFGNPNMDVNGVCISACGLTLADGVTAYSARSDIQDTGVPGWYVYDVDSAKTLTYGRGERWNAPAFQNDRWYTVDEYIRMNTPGVNDGSLVTYIDGAKVFERDTYNFRTVSTLKVGNAWFDIYFGGNGVAPNDMFVDFASVLMEWG